MVAVKHKEEAVVASSVEVECLVEAEVVEEAAAEAAAEELTEEDKEEACLDLCLVEEEANNKLSNNNHKEDKLDQLHRL